MNRRWTAEEAFERESKGMMSDTGVFLSFDISNLGAERLAKGHRCLD